MSTKATATRIYEYGEPDVFRFETMDVPDPVGHEVLVRNTVTISAIYGNTRCGSRNGWK